MPLEKKKKKLKYQLESEMKNSPNVPVIGRIMALKDVHILIPRLVNMQSYRVKWNYDYSWNSGY